MTAGEWDAYGDACASHENVTIDGVEYTDIVTVRLIVDSVEDGTPAEVPQ
jgi:hypothetical protein